MLRLQEKAVPFKIVASGQNDIQGSAVLQALNGGKLDLVLSSEKDIRKSAVGLMKWYLQTSAKAKKSLFNTFPDADFTHSVMIVHGDTVSTMMGAILGKKLGMTVAHVEAGLRSYHWFNPFPEEIDRMVTSRMARLHFAPGEVPCRNLRKAKGQVIDTVYNTIVDSLAYSRSVACKDQRITKWQGTSYFVFALHRQENLAQKALVETLVKRISKQAETMRCAIILHKPTEVTLREMGLLDAILSNPNITAFPRVEYFDFMKLLDGAQFVITDGGSNQEELSYMGKPCLVVRAHTERQDGLGQNVLLYGGSFKAIDAFIEHYPEYRRTPILPEFSPSQQIADVLTRLQLYIHHSEKKGDGI